MLYYVVQENVNVMFISSQQPAFWLNISKYAFNLGYR